MPERAGALDQAAIESLVDTVGGDMEFIVEPIDTYLADAPIQVEAPRKALAAGDVEAMVRPAHTLKSSSASLGAPGLAERCRLLEQAAGGRSVDGASDAVQVIAAELERVVSALDLTKRSFAP